MNLPHTLRKRALYLVGTTSATAILVAAGVLAARNDDEETRATSADTTTNIDKPISAPPHFPLLLPGLYVPSIPQWWYTYSRTHCEQQRGILNFENLSKRLTNARSRRRLKDLYNVKWAKPIGEGAFGEVYSATSFATNKTVACKKISKVYTDNVGFQREMLAFLHIRANGGHPNICSLHEHFDEGSDYYLIMDFISGGEMFEHLINKYVTYRLVASAVVPLHI
jgi:hypothetical protein